VQLLRVQITVQSGESGGPICEQVHNPVNEQGPFKSCNSSVASRKLQSIVQICEERKEAEWAQGSSRNE